METFSSVDQEEQIWPDDEKMTREDILATDGMYYFHKIAAKLGLSARFISREKRTAERRGIQTLHTLGFGKMPNNKYYVVKMSCFRSYYRRLNRTLEIAKNEIHATERISDEQLKEMQGYVKLRRLIERTPFKARSWFIRREAAIQVGKENNPMGVVKKGPVFWVNLQTFLAWFEKNVKKNKKEPLQEKDSEQPAEG